MAKKLSHIETFHRLTQDKHRGERHSVKQIPGSFRKVSWGSLEPGVQMQCVCGHTSCTYDTQLIDDPGACNTCGTALKRFEMFSTAYERCYTCEPVSATIPQELTFKPSQPKNSCVGFWYFDVPVGSLYTDFWNGYKRIEDIPVVYLVDFRNERQFLYTLEWSGEVKISETWREWCFTKENPATIVKKLKPSEY